MNEVDTLEPLEVKSTVLEETAPASPSGGGEPKLEKPEPEKPLSLRDVIADEAKKESTDDEKPEPKDDADDKAKDSKAEAKKDEPDEKQPAKDAKAAADPKAAAVKDEQQSKADEQQEKPNEQGKGRIDPPKNFLPDAKETWRNTPRAVQRDVENIVRQHETEVADLRKATERYESIREYDELASSNGRDLKDSLAKMSQIEDMLQTNPYAGLNAILQEIGPSRPDGTKPSLFEISQYIVQQGPEGWQKMVQQPQPQQQQENPEIAQLRATVAEMQQQSIESSVITPFKTDNPRYDELKNDIAFFLKSGKIPADLSLPDRLAAAYDMAERINPPSHIEPTADANLDEPSRVDQSGSSGSKSIKSAPGSVITDHAPERGGSIRDLLSDEMKRQKRA